MDHRLERADAIYERCFRIWRAIAVLVGLLFAIGLFTGSKIVSQLIFLGVIASFVPGLGMAYGFFAGAWFRWRR
jgi:hypothetical protein